MHPLLRYTLDLFEPNPPLALVNQAPKAIKKEALGPHEPGTPLHQLVAPAAFRHPRANREACLCNALVAYEFKRGKRRTIGFSVGPDGLVVRAPRWAAIHEVEAALQEKSLWIVRKLGEARERQQRLVDKRIEWRDGTSFPFLGQPVRLLLEPRHAFDAAGAQLQTQEGAQTLLVSLPHTAAPEQIRDAVQAWLMKQAKRVFVERLDHFAPQLQVSWRKLSLSNAGTRWGSARIDGAIRLNWRLIHFKQSVIDYVVAHELSHLREMNHSAQFWHTVESVVPDYAALRAELRNDAVPRWG